MDLDKIKKVHFIGIGGIGVSAIARMMLDMGKTVSGSDRSKSIVTDKLKELGVKVYSEHSRDNLDEDTDLVIYTKAIPEDNPELLKAQELDIQVLSYPQSLGLISKDFKTIAVSGTHGKTTTTAMAANALISSGLDPTVIVGSLLKESGSNYIKGKSGYFLVEACEYKRSFLNINPNILIINNLEEEHLDYFKDLKDVQSAFEELASKIPEEGFLICNKSDPNLEPVLRNLKCSIVDYTKYIDKRMKLKIPGYHNLENAAAVLALGEILNLNQETVKKSLIEYTGVWRRFEYKGKTKEGVLIYDDYAHHPTEIRVTLKGARDFFDNKIFVVFHPHSYSRTKKFLSEFGRSFNGADGVLVLPIFAAREEEDESINSRMLVDEIKENGVSSGFVKDFEEARTYLTKHTQKGDVVMTVGAGDVYKLGEAMLEKT